MRFVGRSRELGLLRRTLDATIPQAMAVTGPPGSGKSAIVRRALEGRPHLFFRCPPLPESEQRRAIANQLDLLAGGERGDRGDRAASTVPGWRSIFGHSSDLARSMGGNFTLVLDDAHHLLTARSKISAEDAEALEASTHVILIGSGRLPAVGELDPTALQIGPLPFRSATPLLPGADPSAKLRAYGMFGGLPGVLRHLDTSLTPESNAKRFLLGDEYRGPESPAAWIARSLQSPHRYVAILRALASGSLRWADLHAAIPDVAAGGQIAPYIHRLVDLGLVSVRRSLDAEPTSRDRRYSLTDPFTAFWARYLLPYRYGTESADGSTYFSTAIRPELPEHMEHVLAQVARQHMAFDSIETLGTSSRIHGSLWGKSGEITCAGTLMNGVPFYGVTTWKEPSRSASPLDALDVSVAKTRYGFGRERRLRLVFCGKPAPTWLRRVCARREDALLLEPAHLAGDTAS